VIKERDLLLHYPYQSFDSMIDLLREAAIDPKVEAIKMTLYRVAKNSNIVNALINAVKNGTDVTVMMELQARFDEEANIYWANKLEEEGAKVLHGIPGYKVHAKLCLIRRLEQGKLVDYANISTGNYNEVSSRFYSDTALFTADPRITGEVRQVFQFLEDNIKVGRYNHLVVSPLQMRKRFLRLIDEEIALARQGKKAYIDLKINSLVDQEMIEKLYQASRAGVRIRAIVRSSCSLVSGLPELSEGIEVISIVDRFLEHSRLVIFGHGGEPLYYLTSADWMNRNLNHRVEVACPIYDPALQEEIRSFFDIQFQDNRKARIVDAEQRNHYKKKGRRRVFAQEAFYEYLKEKMEAEK
jgi:polyphosphate kinase